MFYNIEFSFRYIGIFFHFSTILGLLTKSSFFQVCILELSLKLQSLVERFYILKNHAGVRGVVDEPVHEGGVEYLYSGWRGEAGVYFKPAITLRGSTSLDTALVRCES